MVITCRIRFIEKAVLLRKADFLNKNITPLLNELN